MAARETGVLGRAVIEPERASLDLMEIRMMSYRLTMCVLLAASALLVGCSPDGTPSERPNFVVVLVDDMRWDDFGAGGNSIVQTPNIDRLAAEGVRFLNSFTTAPLCSPSRGSFLTGLYPHASGIIDNTDRALFSHELSTFPRQLQEAGYDTAFVGKWHMGDDGSRRPGFDYWVSLSGQGANTDPLLTEGETQVMVEGHVTDIFTDRAVSFIERERDKPFLLYFAQKALHPDPALGLLEGGFIAAERHQGLYDDAPIERRPSWGVPPLDKPALMREFPGLAPLGPDTATSDITIRRRWEMMTGVDESVGELLVALERLGELDNTVFVVTSDHGYFYGEHGLDPERRLAYEETARIPMVIRYPRLIQGGSQEDRLALNIDLAPTVLELAGETPGEELQGRSLVPLFAGEASDWRTTFLIEHHTDPEDYLRTSPDTADPADTVVSKFVRMMNMGYRAVRGERYKYIQYTDLEGMDELYDLQADPYEMSNIIDSPEASGVLEEMQAELARLLEETSP